MSQITELLRLSAPPNPLLIPQTVLLKGYSENKDENIKQKSPERNADTVSFKTAKIKGSKSPQGTEASQTTIEETEFRSVTNEIDYKKKDAAREYAFRMSRTSLMN